MTSTATDPAKSLPPRQAAFVREYLVDLNACRAARDVGKLTGDGIQVSVSLGETSELAQFTAEELRQLVSKWRSRGSERFWRHRQA